MADNPTSQDRRSREARIEAQLDALARTAGGREAISQAERFMARAKRWKRLRRFLGGDRWPAVAALPASVAGALLAMVWIGSGDRYIVTDLGERRSIELRDGSVVRLNTDSAVSVVFSDRQRRVILHQGQAVFEVIPDQSHPFVVQAGDGVVTALGTAFDVYFRPGGEVVVTLLKGRVSVERREPTADSHLTPSKADVETAVSSDRETQSSVPLQLDPGEQVTVAPSGNMSEVAKVDVKQVTAWQTGRIYLSGASLEEAVAEINRYSATKIELVGEDLPTVSIAGVFNAGDPNAFVRGVVVRFGCREYRPSAGKIELAC